jgi:hypothetical protein
VVLSGKRLIHTSRNGLFPLPRRCVARRLHRRRTGISNKSNREKTSALPAPDDVDVEAVLVVVFVELATTWPACTMEAPQMSVVPTGNGCVNCELSVISVPPMVAPILGSVADTDAKPDIPRPILLILAGMTKGYPLSSCDI